VLNSETGSGKTLGMCNIMTCMMPLHSIHIDIENQKISEKLFAIYYYNYYFK